MKKWYVYLALLLALNFSACTTAQKRYANTTSQGVYAIQDSLKAGRVDLAQKYAQQLTRVVPAPKPKFRVNIKPVEVKKTIVTPEGKKETTTLHYVVLPKEYTGQPALSIGTPEMNKLTVDNPQLQVQFKEEAKTVEKFEQTVDKTQQAIAKEAAKPKKGFFSRIFGFLGLTGLVGGLVGIGGIVFLAFNPELIPVATALVGRVLRGMISGVGSFIRGLVKKKQ